MLIVRVALLSLALAGRRHRPGTITVGDFRDNQRTGRGSLYCANSDAMTATSSTAGHSAAK